MLLSFDANGYYCLRMCNRTITSHSRFARHTGRDEDYFGAAEALFEGIGRRIVAFHYAFSVDVANVGRNACVEPSQKSSRAVTRTMPIASYRVLP